MDFNAVVGQQDTIQRLLTLERENRIPHAIMLTGPSGCGKMAIALAFASHLLGNSPLLDQWNPPDLHFTYPPIKLPSMGATTQQAIITGAESDELSRKLSMKASMAGYKISIIWMPERMNQTCANKMLKLLEEPPGQTLFILVSEEPEKLLETIRSRTQKIDVKRIDETEMADALVKRRAIDEHAAAQTARLAAGSWTRALEILNAGNENKPFFAMFVLLMRLAYGRRLKELKKWSESVAGYGREKQKRLLAYISRMVRENFMYNFNEQRLNYMTDDEENFAKKFAPFINENNVIGISALIEKAVRDISQNANGKIVFFDFALQIIILLNKKN